MTDWSKLYNKLCRDQNPMRMTKKIEQAILEQFRLDVAANIVDPKRITPRYLKEMIVRLIARSDSEMNFINNVKIECDPNDPNKITITRLEIDHF